MNVRAIHIGQPRAVEWNGKDTSTGIFKESVNRPVRVNFLGLEGDGQADLKAHGGEHKAVYSYSLSNYDWWNQPKPHGRGLPKLPLGIFGENLTIADMIESEYCLGDHFQIGTAILEASQPRQPCFKLQIRFTHARISEPKEIVKEFLKSHRFGIYYRVVQEGVIQPGDDVARVFEHRLKIPVQDVFALVQARHRPQTDEAEQLEKLRDLLTIPTLCPKIQTKARARLAAAGTT